LFEIDQKNIKMKYNLGKLVAKGGTSEVRLVQHKQSGVQRALKIINLADYTPQEKAMLQK